MSYHYLVVGRNDRLQCTASKLIELSLTLAGLKHAVLHRERSVT